VERPLLDALVDRVAQIVGRRRAVRICIQGLLEVGFGLGELAVLVGREPGGDRS
jgi:hypothetical protein